MKRNFHTIMTETLQASIALIGVLYGGCIGFEQADADHISAD